MLTVCMWSVAQWCMVTDFYGLLRYVRVWSVYGRSIFGASGDAGAVTLLGAGREKVRAGAHTCRMVIDVAVRVCLVCA